MYIYISLCVCDCILLYRHNISTKYCCHIQTNNNHQRWISPILIDHAKFTIYISYVSINILNTIVLYYTTLFFIFYFIFLTSHCLLKIRIVRGIKRIVAIYICVSGPIRKLVYFFCFFSSYFSIIIHIRSVWPLSLDSSNASVWSHCIWLVICLYLYLYNIYIYIFILCTLFTYILYKD